MTEGFASPSYAARMREVIAREALKVLRQESPPYRYGTVTQIDADIRQCMVQLAGDPAAIPVRILGVQPKSVGQVVQVAGRHGDRFVSGIVGESLAVDAPTTNLTAPTLSVAPFVEGVLADWSAVTGATKYEVQFADDVGISVNVRTFQTISTSFSLQNIPAGTTIYARVRALNNSGAGPWSTVQNATSDPFPTNPSDGSPPASSPACLLSSGLGYLLAEWLPISNADLVTYEVHISTTTGFTPSGATLVGEAYGTFLFINTEADGTPLEYDTTYFVRIVAKDADGAAAAGAQDSGQIDRVELGDVGNVVSNDLTDGNPPSTSPAVGSIHNGVGFLYTQWDHIANADQVTYEIHISTVNNFTPDANSYVGETPSNWFFIRTQGAGTAYATLVYGTTYYVKLWAKDGDGYAPAAGTQGSGFTLQVNSGDLVDDSVTSDKIADLAITNPKLANLVVTAGKIASGAIDYTKLSSGLEPVRPVGVLPTLPDATYPVGAVVFLTTDGKLYRNVSDSWTAEVPATDLTGQITSTQITDNAITTPKIAARAVTAAEIAVNTITASQIAADTITAGEIAAAAITSTEIAADTILAGNIAAGAIGASEIAALAVTTDKLAANAVTAAKITAGTITSNEIATGTITAGNMVAGTITAASGIIADAAIGTAKIQDAAITTAKIANLAVDTAQINDAAITTAKIGAAQITTALIGDAQITTAKIGAAQITTALIANAAITTALIADANITSAKIANASITTAKIGDAQITDAKISTLTASKITSGTINASSIKIGDYGGGDYIEIVGTAGATHIQSSNFVAGSSGWRIQRNGVAEFSNVTVRGTVESSSFVGGSINITNTFARLVVSSGVVAISGMEFTNDASFNPIFGATGTNTAFWSQSGPISINGSYVDVESVRFSGPNITSVQAITAFATVSVGNLSVPGAGKILFDDTQIYQADGVLGSQAIVLNESNANLLFSQRDGSTTSNGFLSRRDSSGSSGIKMINTPSAAGGIAIQIRSGDDGGWHRISALEFVLSSDRAWKENIVKWGGALTRLRQMQAYRYEPVHLTGASKRRELGFMADEAPAEIVYNANSPDDKKIGLYNLTTFVAVAVQELAAELDKALARIATLEAQVASGT